MNARNFAPIPPLPQRTLRIAALALQSVIVATVLILGLIGASSPVRERVFAFLGSGSHPGAAPFVAVLCLAWVLAVAATFLAAWRLQSRSWWNIALGYVAMGLVIAYLAHDEPAIRHPLTMEEISPVFPGAEASYNVLMTYGKQHPLGRNFKAPSFKDPYPNFVPGKPGIWREAITSHRAEIEAHWAGLTAERAWWAQLGAFDRIGDLMPARFDGEIPSFQVFRTISQHGLAIASLEALDGHGDEAIDTLLPVLEVGRKLQPYSRSLVRDMIAVVIERNSLDTAAFILDNNTVSPAARARLAAALQGGDAEAGARHLFSTEYALNLGAMGSSRVGDIMASMGSLEKHPWLIRGLNAVSPFLYTPHRTFNQIGDLYSNWQDIAAHRQLDQLDIRWKAFLDEESRPGIRNIFGRWLELEMIPAYVKVSENYWRTQDQRAALLARLAKT
jgi:hypothetical protein